MKQYFSKVLELKKKALLLMVLEIILSIIAVYEFTKVIGLNIDFDSRIISFTPVGALLHPLLLIISLIALFAINLRMKKTFPEVHAIQGLFFHTVKHGVREKFSDTRKDPRILAHIFIEICFIMVVTLVLWAWSEPNVEIISWEKIGLTPPVTTIANAIILLIVLAGLYYLYNFTKQFRIERKQKKRFD